MNLKGKIFLSFSIVILLLLSKTLYQVNQETEQLEMARIFNELDSAQTQFLNRLEEQQNVISKLLQTITLDQKFRAFLSKMKENFYSFTEEIAVDTNGDIVFMVDENLKLKNPKSADEIESDALITSALLSYEKALDLGLGKDKIIISCKVSRLNQMIHCYREISKRCSAPLHLGLTEAGMGIKSIVATSAALSILLEQGIGDTIRSSLTPEVGSPRSREVELCQEILQSLAIRSYKPEVTSCPGCGRTTSTYFRELASEINVYLDNKKKKWADKYPGSENLKVAVMGCVVNGPGESKAANIGVSLPGSGESPAAPVYVDGKKIKVLKGNNISGEFIDMVESYVEKKWGDK